MDLKRNGRDWLPRARKVVVLLWLVSLVTGLGAYLLHRERVSPWFIAEMLREFGQLLMLAYLVVSVVRAFFLIPSTPFVLAGGLLFPQQPGTVLLVSMVGIALSASLIYGFSDWLGVRDHLRRVSGPVYERLETTLKGRYSFFYLVLWSFFPLAPTDAACYVAGIVRMPFAKFLAGICLGELIICAVYVMAGRGLWELIMSSAG